MTNKKKITAKELDKKFDDDSEDLMEYFETENPTKSILLNLPFEMVEAIDLEAKRTGIARSAIIKVWLQDKLDQNEHSRALVKKQLG